MEFLRSDFSGVENCLHIALGSLYSEIYDIRSRICDAETFHDELSLREDLSHFLSELFDVVSCSLTVNSYLKDDCSCGLCVDALRVDLTPEREVDDGC